MILVKYNTRVSSEMSSLQCFLEEFERFFVDPVCAGGAPREWFFNKGIEDDIDVFVNPTSDIEGFLFYLSSIEIGYRKQDGENLSEDYKSDSIKSVITLRYQNIKFQVIVRKSEEPFVNCIEKEFSCNMSRIYFLEDCIIPTDSFLYGLRYSVLIFNFKENSTERYKMYCQKYMNYFPRFSLNFKEEIDQILPLL